MKFYYFKNSSVTNTVGFWIFSKFWGPKKLPKTEFYNLLSLEFGEGLGENWRVGRQDRFVSPKGGPVEISLFDAQNDVTGVFVSFKLLHIGDKVSWNLKLTKDFKKFRKPGKFETIPEWFSILIESFLAPASASSVNWKLGELCGSK